MRSLGGDHDSLRGQKTTGVPTGVYPREDSGTGCRWPSSPSAVVACDHSIRETPWISPIFWHSAFKSHTRPSERPKQASKRLSESLPRVSLKWRIKTPDWPVKADQVDRTLSDADGMKLTTRR